MEEEKKMKMALTVRAHMQLVLTEFLTENVTEWHGFNFLKFQWHTPDNTNNSIIFFNWYICSGMDPTDPYFIGHPSDRYN